MITGKIEDFEKKWKFSDNGRGDVILKNKLGEWKSSQKWREMKYSNGIKIQNVLTQSFLGKTGDTEEISSDNSEPKSKFIYPYKIHLHYGKNC